MRRGPAILWLGVLAIVLSTAAIRVRLLDIPLERDEGEYAYMGQLMLQGIPPFKLAWNLKFPGTHAAYALIMALFGQTVAGIHFGLLLVNAASIVLTFLLGERLFGPAAGVAASATFAMLSIGAGVLGTQAHATHFVVLSALIGIVLLLRSEDSESPVAAFWSGLFLGLALLMKQQGIFFVFFGIAYLSARKIRWKKIPIFSLATMLPLAITALLLWRAGVFDRFWFWTVTFAQEYGSYVFLYEAPAMLLRQAGMVIPSNLLLWLMAGAGIVLLVKNRKMHRCAWFVIALLAFSFLSICPGFYFRQHYFVLLLPAVALLVGVAADSMKRRYNSTTVICLLAALFAFSIYRQRDFLFRITPLQASAMMYPGNPFPEAVELGNYLREHSSKNATIAVLGSEPEICFYANRHSASGYLFTDPLMRTQPYESDMQREFIREIEASKPEYAVVVKSSTSWLQGNLHDPQLFEWWLSYSPSRYAPVSFSEISPAHEETQVLAVFRRIEP